MTDARTLGGGEHADPADSRVYALVNPGEVFARAPISYQAGVDRAF
jgi:hypothetical protein